MFCRNRPTLPSHVVNQRVDNNNQPHVIQRYHVPSPQNNQYRRHDEAVYSMWMHFVIYCSLDPESINSHRQIEAEIAAFAHPQYEYPLESTNTLLLASSPKGSQSKNLHISHHQCSFLDGTLAVNPFTNVNRLDVFRSLSSGEGSQLFSSTRDSSSYSSLAHAPSPEEDSLDVGCAAYPFSKSHISPNVRSMNSPVATRQPSNYDDPLISCEGKNLLHISQPMDIEKHNLTEQRSKLFTATSHQYFKAKARTVSTIGLGDNAVHLDQVVLSGVDHMTSGSCTGVGAVAMSNRSLLSRLEESRTSEWELGKTTSFKACDRAIIIAEDNGTFDIDEEIKRSLCNLNDVEESSPPLNVSRISSTTDNIWSSGSHLADTSLYISPEADRTPERNSPLDFDMATLTDISNMSSFSPSSLKNIQLDS